MSKQTSLFIIIFACLVAISLRLFFVQVYSGERKDSAVPYLKTKRLTPVRGSIFDRNLHPLAVSQVNYTLFAELNKIDQKDTVVEQLEGVLHMGEATLEGKIMQDKKWVVVNPSIDQDTYEKLQKLKIEGIGFEEKRKRFYPEGSVSSHLVGFVGQTETGDPIGYFGIEGYYEKELAGVPGIIKTERDLLGNPIFVGVQEKINGEDGGDIILTIDRTIQSLAKKKLKEGIDRYGAVEGCIIIINPHNGEIYALVCLPDFDQNEYSKFSESLFKNPTISNVYEPGSIFKPLIMAAALNEGKITPDEIYDEKGPIQIGKYEIRTWNNTYEGKISMTRILEKSSNVGLVHVGQKLGTENLLSYIKKYGIGNLSGIDLQGETAGFLKKQDTWHEIDYATATFGQGLVLTQIQMIRAFASLVNGGYLITPHVVFKIRSSDGRERVMSSGKKKRVLKESTSKKIISMLEKTVENGDAKWARPQGYRIGGKTGTAQIPIGSSYDTSKTVASFIGFAPVDAPQFLVLVTLREPTASPWGSETAAPLFFELTKDLILYYNIAPE